MMEKHILELLEPEGFMKQFYLFCGEYIGDQQKAYEATERLYKQNFGKRRYSNWLCFKEIKNRKLRESIKKRKQCFDKVK